MKMKELYSSWHFMTFMNLICTVKSHLQRGATSVFVVYGRIFSPQSVIESPTYGPWKNILVTYPYIRLYKIRWKMDNPSLNSNHRFPMVTQSTKKFKEQVVNFQVLLIFCQSPDCAMVGYLSVFQEDILWILPYKCLLQPFSPNQLFP